MRHKRLFPATMLLALGMAATASGLRAQSLDGWTLTFQDEFNGTTLDTSKWNTCYEDQGAGTGTPCTLQGNAEMELYQPTGQLTEADGVLTIEGDKRNVVDPVTGAPYDYASGMIASWNKFSQTQGYFEMRAKLPAGIGFWPAFWMDNNNHTWPPEIDTMEMIGAMPDGPHVGAISSTKGAYLAQYVYTFDTSTAYHTYGVEWDSNNLTYYYDGQIVAQTATASNMTNPMQLIANLAIGGSWPGPPTAATTFPAYMKIDYIRAWTRNDTTAAIPHTSGQDVGSTGLTGSTSLDTNANASIQGAGRGYFHYPSDSFHYSAKPLPGDGDFTMKVNSVPAPTGPHTPQTGIMVRESMDADAKYVAVFLANGKCILQSRLVTGGIPIRIATQRGVTAPSWLRLVRKEDSFSVYISTDGINWNLVGITKNYIASATMGKSAFIGAAVSSGDPGSYNTASITNFDLPAIQITQDNADSTGVTFQGSWPASTNNGGYYGTNYITDGNTNKGNMSVTFTPTIPSTSLYDVYFRFVGNETGRATNVPITINGNDGASTVYVNEQHHGSEWIYLGSYNFAAGATGSVVISNAGTTSTVSVDAVRFTPGLATPPLKATLPPPPRHFELTSAPSNNQVTLTWNEAPFASSYNILRATSASGPYTVIATEVPTGLDRYTDTTVTAGTSYYYQVAGVNSTGQGAPSEPVAAIGSIIVDDTAATKVGSWPASTTAATLYYGSDYVTDGDTGATGGKSITYTPALPIAGNYAVYMRYPAGTNRASNVPVDIHSSGSAVSTVTVNELTSDNIWWNYLGTYSFDADNTGSVVIRNDGANGYVIADAIEFVYMPADPHEAEALEHGGRWRDHAREPEHIRRYVMPHRQPGQNSANNQ